MNGKFLTDFKSTILQAYAELKEIPEDAAAAKPDENHWSNKELLGHLIDSASNNHQRIVRLQIFDEIEFPNYQQDEFVRVNNYQSRDWESLVEFWKAYNQHLAHVIENVDKEKLDNIWVTSDGDRLTLGHIIEDYLRHLKHH